ALAPAINMVQIKDLYSPVAPTAMVVTRSKGKAVLPVEEEENTSMPSKPAAWQEQRKVRDQVTRMVQEAQVTVQRGQECSGASTVQAGHLDKMKKVCPEQVMHPAECSKVQRQKEAAWKDITVSVPAQSQIAEIAECSKVHEQKEAARIEITVSVPEQSQIA